MKKIHLLIPAVAAALAASKASAQLLYEPFEYGSSAVGTNLANTTGSPTFTGYINPMNGQVWADAQTTTTPLEYKVTSGSSGTISGLQAPAGDSAGTTTASTTTNATARLGIGQAAITANGATVFYSLTLKVTDLTNLTTGGAFVAGLNNSAGTQSGQPTVVGARLYLKQAGAGNYNIGLANATVQNMDTTDTFHANDTVFVVASYTNGANAAADSSSLWINPASSTFGNATAPTPTVASLTTAGLTETIRSLILRAGNGAEPAGIQFDEVRADTTWAQVTAPTGSSLTTSGGSWSDPTVWNSGAGPVPSGSSGPTSFAYFTGGGGNVDLSAPQTVSTLTFKSSNSYSITGSGGSLTLGSNVINLQPQMDTMGPDVALAGAHVISANVVLSGASPAFTVNAATNQTLTVSGNITNGGTGTASIVKNGPGTLVLSGTNGFSSGATTVNFGSLVLRSSSAVGTGAFSLSNGSTLDLANNNMSATTFTQTASGAGVGGPALLGSISGTGTITAATSYAFQSGTVSPILAGATATLTKSTANTLTLSGANTYGGLTTLAASGGVLRADDGVGLPTNSPLKMLDGELETGANFVRPLGTTGNSVQLATGGTSGAGFSSFGASPIVVALGGTGSPTALTWGSTNFSPFALVLNTPAATNMLDFRNAVDLSSATARTVNVGANVATLSGVITNSNASPGGFVKTGAGTLVLTNAGNTYGGVTTISGGTLAITSDAVLGGITAPPNPSILISSSTLEFLGNMSTNANRWLQLIGPSTIDVDNHTVLFTGQILTNNGTDTLILASTGGAGIFQMNNSGSSYRSLTIDSNTSLQLASSFNDGLLGDTSTTAGVGKQNWLTFDGGTLKISASNINGAGTHGGDKGITVTSNGGTVDTGGLTITFPMTGTAVTGITGTGTLSVQGGGTFNVGSTSAVSIRTGGLTINGSGTRVNLPQSGGVAAGTSNIPALTINAGQLNLSDNKLVTTTALSTVTGYIQTGRAGGAWTGNGLITTQAAANGVSAMTTLGVDTGADVKNLTGTATATWSGQTVHATDTLVMYTYAGDANLDGMVSGDDYAKIDAGFAAQSPSMSGYANGDFNYDGKINADDYFLIDKNYSAQGAPFPAGPVLGGAALSGVSAVPEPASLGLLMLAGMGLRRRRRTQA